MTILEQYIDCMQKGDETALADLFNEYGVLHDSSVYKAGMDTIHLEGKMAVEMMFHHKFGFNGGPFPIHSVKYVDYLGKKRIESAFYNPKSKLKT